MLCMMFLEDRTIISIAGLGAHKFLQALISNNVELVRTQGAIFTALLNPQGKFLHDFFVVQAGEEAGELLLDVEARQAEMLLATLTKYKLRSQVEMQLRNDLYVYADFASGTQDALTFTDPRHPNMGVRIISSSQLATKASLPEYHARRIANCIPEGSHDMIYEKSFLLENNYDTINAIDFTKGCYVGQEVTARAKYRGEVRKRIYVVQGQGEMPPFGTEIMAIAKDGSGGVRLGEMRSSVDGSCGSVGLAQLRIAELQLAIASQQIITAGGATLHMRQPD